MVMFAEGRSLTLEIARNETTGSNGEGDSSSTRKVLCRRLGSFLILHFAALLSEILAMADFIMTANYNMIYGMMAPLILSGMVCTHAAWHAEPTQLYWAWGLPLRNQPWWLKATLWVPLGLFQGVIVLLAYDEFLDRQEQQNGQPQHRESSAWNRYHCKAVAALCEGLPAITVLACAWWSLNYPPESPLMKMSWHYERPFLGILGIILFISAGSGMVELDFCCSGAVAREIRRSYRYEMLHLIYRCCEVLSRTVMMVAFVVTTRHLVSWWWCPAASNIIFTYLLVVWHGGDETRFSVRLLCSLPCAWVNLFFFVDSPYKRRAARKISMWLDIKFFLEVLILPLLVVSAAATAGEQAWNDLKNNIRMHSFMFYSMVACLCGYFFLWLYLQCTIVRQINLIDVYTAAENGNTQEVKDVMEKLVAEIKELTRSASAGMDVNRPDVDGNTPLMLATRMGHAEVCECLLQAGALVSIRHSGKRSLPRNFCTRPAQRGWTALHEAAWQGQDRVIRALLEGGALEEEGVDYVDLRGETPLHVATRSGNLEAARLLALACPRWTATLDLRGKRPCDLARSEGLRMSLAQSWGSWDPEQFQARAQAAAEELNLPTWRNPPRRHTGQEDWCSVPLHISRNKELLVAPGICSYIAASCGGALGRLCLTKAEEVREPSSPPEERLKLEDLVQIDPFGREVSYFGRELSPWQNAPALIGEGRFGEVFRAKHRQSGNWYAVKVFKTQQRPVAPEVVRECEVGTHVRQTPHPCIVQLHMVNLDGAGMYTLVMEFCQSNLLQQLRAAKRGRGAVFRPPPQTLDWVGQIFLGLEHMHHRLNTMFRDLKPENVVLDGQLCCKLADFGAGRVGPSSGTFSFGHPAGSPGYIAPEVLGGMPHDEGADLYSLGVLAWLLFTGGMPNEVPPMAVRPEWQAHLYDWTMLDRCIRDNFPPFQGVEQAGAEQASEARQFVDLLIKPPTARMRHEQLRRHPLLLPIRLPEFAATPHQVEEWLLQRGFADRNQRPQRPASTSWGSISSGGRSAADTPAR